MSTPLRLRTQALIDRMDIYPGPRRWQADCPLSYLITKVPRQSAKPSGLVTVVLLPFTLPLFRRCRTSTRLTVYGGLQGITMMPQSWNATSPTLPTLLPSLGRMESVIWISQWLRPPATSITATRSTVPDTSICQTFHRTSPCRPTWVRSQCITTPSSRDTHTRQ